MAPRRLLPLHYDEPPYGPGWLGQFPVGGLADVPGPDARLAAIRAGFPHTPTPASAYARRQSEVGPPVAPPGQGQGLTAGAPGVASAAGAAADPSVNPNLDGPTDLQAGFAAAAQNVAPILGDYRTTPAQVLAAAVGGYGGGVFQNRRERRADQLTAQREKYLEAQAALETRKAERQGRMDDQTEATLAGIEAGNPELGARLRFLYNAGDTAGLDELIAPKKKAPIEVSGRLIDPDTFQPVYTDPNYGQPTAYQQAELGLQRLAISRQQGPETFDPNIITGKAAEALNLDPSGHYQRNNRGEIKLVGGAGGGPSPEFITAQDPADPTQSIYLNKRTSEPLLGAEGKPVRPSAAKESNLGFTQANSLRDEYQRITQPIRGVLANYGKLNGALKEETGAGDIAVIFNYMKILDPTSVVREGEQATALNTGGLPDYVTNLYNKALSGERLTPEQRQNFKTAAATQVAPYKGQYEQLTGQYTDLANRFQVDPKNVVTPIDFPSEFSASDTQPQSSSAGPAGVAATGTPAGGAATGTTTAKPPDHPAIAKKILDETFGQ